MNHLVINKLKEINQLQNYFELNELDCTIKGEKL